MLDMAITFAENNSNVINYYIYTVLSLPILYVIGSFLASDK